LFPGERPRLDYPAQLIRVNFVRYTGIKDEIYKIKNSGLPASFTPRRQ
jgi:hypothetical protein